MEGISYEYKNTQLFLSGQITDMIKKFTFRDVYDEQSQQQYRKLVNITYLLTIYGINVVIIFDPEYIRVEIYYRGIGNPFIQRIENLCGVNTDNTFMALAIMIEDSINNNYYPSKQISQVQKTLKVLNRVRYSEEIDTTERGLAEKAKFIRYQVLYNNNDVNLHYIENSEGLSTAPTITVLINHRKKCKLCSMEKSYFNQYKGINMRSFLVSLILKAECGIINFSNIRGTVVYYDFDELLHMLAINSAELTRL